MLVICSWSTSSRRPSRPREPGSTSIHACSTLAYSGSSVSFSLHTQLSRLYRILMGLISLVSFQALVAWLRRSAAVVLTGIVLGIVVCWRVGLWMLKKWGFWLTVVVSVLNLLSAAPGVVFAPSSALKALPQ